MKGLRIAGFLLIFWMFFMGESMAQNTNAYNTAFTTAMTFQNVDSTTATVTLNYYTQTGSVIALPTQTLEPGAGTTLWVGGLTAVGNGSAGSIVLDTNQEVVTTLVQIPASGSPVKTRMLSNSFRSLSSTQVLIASALKNQFNTTSRFSIQNAATQSIKLVLTFYSAASPIVINEPTVPLGAAKYYDLGALSQIPTPFDGTVIVQGFLGSGNTPAPIVGTVMELSTNGNAAKAFEGVGSGANTVYMATALCGSFNTNTAYAVQNVSANAMNVTVSYSNSTAQTKNISAGGKQSFAACDVTGTNFSGAATITAGGPIIAIGKAFKTNDAAYSTAFLGETSGAARLAFPYVRWTSNTNYNSGARQRTFLAIQNVGSSTATQVTVKYLNKVGAIVGVHSIGSINAGAKANSNASNAGTTPELTEFGNPEANPGGGYGGAAIVEGVGQLIAIARVVSVTNPNVNPVLDVAEDYNGIQVP